MITSNNLPNTAGSNGTWYDSRLNSTARPDWKWATTVRRPDQIFKDPNDHLEWHRAQMDYSTNKIYTVWDQDEVNSSYDYQVFYNVVTP
jgi:hypothetical protein